MPGTVIAQSGSQVIAEAVRADPVSRDQVIRGSTPPDQWTAATLHDYVAEEIARRGPQLPCAESMVIAADFIRRFGQETAARIVLAAFGAYGGIWMGAPVSWRRLTSSNDDFFGRRIAASLSAA